MIDTLRAVAKLAAAGHYHPSPTAPTRQGVAGSNEALILIRDIMRPDDVSRASAHAG